MAENYYLVFFILFLDKMGSLCEITNSKGGRHWRKKKGTTYDVSFPGIVVKIAVCLERVNPF